MKSKKTLTASQVMAIKKLIAEKLEAPPHKQKSIRQKIRDIGFYYSDFGSNPTGYTVEDFEEVLRSGRIQVVG